MVEEHILKCAERGLGSRPRNSAVTELLHEATVQYANERWVHWEQERKVELATVGKSKIEPRDNAAKEAVELARDEFGASLISQDTIWARMRKHEAL